MAVCRFIDLEFTRSFTEQQLDGHSFDAIIDFCSLPVNADITTVAGYFEELLVPGGVLILSETNRSAWEYNEPGIKWYSFVFGEAASMRTFPLSTVIESLSRQGFQFLTLTSDDPFHFIVECQKPIMATSGILYNDLESFTFEYHEGQEDDLQWSFSGLDPMQELDIWIVATEGKDGDAAVGLLRGIRREMLKWTIRLVIYPSSFTYDERTKILQSLPDHMAKELEIIVDANSNLLVSRIVPIPAPNDHDCNIIPPSALDVPEHHAAVHVLASHSAEIFVVIFGQVVTSQSELPAGSFVTGISHELGEYLIMDAAGLCLVPAQLMGRIQSVLNQLAGFMIAVLALSLSVVRRPGRLSSMRILLTHCDSLIGLGIRQFFDSQNVAITEIPEDEDFLQILQHGLGATDLVISGYVEPGRAQVLRKLLRRGRLFSWKDEDDGILGILHRNPCVLGDSISECLKIIKELTNDLIVNVPHPASPPNMLPITKSARSLFDSTKTYLLLGGIGSLGAHIALWMYEVRIPSDGLINLFN